MVMCVGGGIYAHANHFLGVRECLFIICLVIMEVQF